MRCCLWSTRAWPWWMCLWVQDLMEMFYKELLTESDSPFHRARALRWAPLMLGQARAWKGSPWFALRRSPASVESDSVQSHHCHSNPACCKVLRKGRCERRPT